MITVVEQNHSCCSCVTLIWNITVSSLPKVHSLCSAAMLFAVYALCMYALYSFMPVVVKMTSATAVNLSLLTADLFSLFCGIFLFHYTVSVINKHHSVSSWCYNVAVRYLFTFNGLETCLMLHRVSLRNYAVYITPGEKYFVQQDF